MSETNEMKAGENVSVKLEAWCIKCKGKKEILEAVDGKFKNGTAIKTGKCGGCGGKLFRILGKQK